MMTCKKCNTGNMVPKSGKHGDFLACDRYPDCNNTENVVVQNGGTITKSNGKDTLIIRQCCLKAAVEMHKDRNDTSGLLPLAEEFEKWVNR